MDDWDIHIHSLIVEEHCIPPWSCCIVPFVVDPIVVFFEIIVEEKEVLLPGEVSVVNRISRVSGGVL